MKLVISVFLLLVSATTTLAAVHTGETISRERKAFSLVEMMKVLVSNDERVGEGQELTQAELNRISYFLHYYQFDSFDLAASKEELARQTMGADVKNPLELERFLSDFSWIRGRMNDWELGSGLKCKFAYYDWLDWAIRVDPCKGEDSPCRSKGTDRRTIAGLCWEKENYRD